MSSLISGSRAYIKSRILLCDSDYQEIKDPVGTDDLQLSNIDKHYKLIIGADSPFLDGNFYGDIIACELEIYKKAGYSETEDFDNLYDLAIDIKNEIIDPTVVKNSTVFSDIEIISLIPEPLNSNDKVFKIITTLQIRRDFAYQGELT